MRMIITVGASLYCIQNNFTFKQGYLLVQASARKEHILNGK